MKGLFSCTMGYLLIIRIIESITFHLYSYVKSISYKQLSGKSNIASDTLSKECKPVKFVSDLKREVYSVGGFYLSEDKIANPCGLVAKSFFNDTYILHDETKTEIPLKTTEITHKIDRERVFKRNPQFHRDQYIDVEDGIFYFIKNILLIG